MEKKINGFKDIRRKYHLSKMEKLNFDPKKKDRNFFFSLSHWLFPEKIQENRNNFLINILSKKKKRQRKNAQGCSK